MSWTLAHNLKVRSDEVHAVWPTMTIYSIGDQAHQAECSDHNPDARDIVHAIDIMTETDASYNGAAAVILKWVLSSTADLEYVIHDRKIYERKNAFNPVTYTGTDPHTNHIHVSGRHGTVGKDAATCTGYNVTAEAMTPEGIDMLSAADVWNYAIPGLLDANGKPISAAEALRIIYVRTGTTANSQLNPKIAGSVAADVESVLAAVSKPPLPTAGITFGSTVQLTEPTS